MFHYFHSGEVQRTAKKAKPDSSNKICTYDCDLCDCGDWLSETEVEMHKKSMHSRQLTKLVNNKANVCMSCTKVLSDHTTLIEHIKFHHLYSSKNARRIEREIFICDHCDQIFFNKKLLILHIARRHTQKPNSIVLECPLCHKNKISRLMYTHLTNHQLQSVSLCQICLHKQRNTKALAKHLDTHPKHYHCNICGYISTKEKDFNMHLDMYERRKKQFQVKNYKEYFLHPGRKDRWTLNSLRVGLQGLIMYNEIYICVLCRHICTCHNDMQEHILRDHSTEPDLGESAAKKVCTCGEQFSNMILFKHHIFKTKGQHRLSYTEIDQSAGEESSDDELATEAEGPKPEIIHQIEAGASYNYDITVIRESENENENIPAEENTEMNIDIKPDEENEPAT